MLMSSRKNGYTLVEILVVTTILVVLGILLLIGINPMAQIYKGYDARRKADLQKIKTALENYYSDHECYPVFPITDSAGLPSYTCESDFLRPYLDSMPCDPNSKKPYTIYLVPAVSVCPQNFAAYAKISSYYDPNANDIAKCPDTIEVHSPNMTNFDTIYGCSGQVEVCPIHYGCKKGACVVVADDRIPSCSPSFCDSKCSPIKIGTKTIDCTSKKADGSYIRECIEF